jgi:TolA-binding protein
MNYAIWESVAHFRAAFNHPDFKSALAQYPDSEKTGNATFRKGLCLLRLEKREEGISTLKTVISRYPKSMAAENAKKELSRLGENY